MLYVVTQGLGCWQVRAGTITSPPIATFGVEGDARMFAAEKERRARQVSPSSDPWGLCEERVDEAHQIQGGAA
jgi:hypothetical protein